MVVLYDLALSFYHVFIRIASLNNAKAAKWIAGRKEAWKQLEQTHEGNWIWFHCASLGEFEQGRPLIEQTRNQFPEHRILLTFFSPSGYEIRKNYEGVDLVTYLPYDTKSNMKRLLREFNPELVVFIKYELWHHLLEALHRKSIPYLIVSANFRPGQIFFRPYGAMFRKMLQRAHTIFVQDPGSRKLLDEIGITNVEVSGDTRFDRVMKISEQGTVPAIIKDFAAGKKVLVAGSTWPADEALLLDLYKSDVFRDWKLIIAPHEIENLERFRKLAVSMYSEFRENSSSEILVIDRIGLLSSIYGVGSAAYIGGGFGKGIHNTLEAAVYGIPVFFGPNFEKFREAVALVDEGGAFSHLNFEEFQKHFSAIVENEAVRLSAGEIAARYVRSNTGATSKIMKEISALLAVAQ